MMPIVTVPQIRVLQASRQLLLQQARAYLKATIRAPEAEAGPGRNACHVTGGHARAAHVLTAFPAVLA